MNVRSFLASSVLCAAPFVLRLAGASTPGGTTPFPAASASASGSASKSLACVTVSADVRYGSPGYNHWVIIDNACLHAIACVVSTDVAPEPIPVSVDAKSRAEVLTFRGSPASVFQPRAECVKK
jgi:hypothetical protein